MAYFYVTPASYFAALFGRETAVPRLPTITEADRGWRCGLWTSAAALDQLDWTRSMVADEVPLEDYARFQKNEVGLEAEKKLARDRRHLDYQQLWAIKHRLEVDKGMRSMLYRSSSIRWWQTAGVQENGPEIIGTEMSDDEDDPLGRADVGLNQSGGYWKLHLIHGIRILFRSTPRARGAGTPYTTLMANHFACGGSIPFADALLCVASSVYCRHGIGPSPLRAIKLGKHIQHARVYGGSSLEYLCRLPSRGQADRRILRGASY
ncbi:hypothetical protein BZA05DRAFT_433360 [Tricharina praecox]|uniref:uncharacterized protein n=1 Tax=Tricharina praecox TaxID=43433 RepID=UPI00221E5550|nr:uncharacterized protein BZA05DRAFT_433360 [Tricharina praecox]KAI5857972.1 hypothetical protein BZA05DRAFT_433360 [Tricharina praecox]